MAQQPEKGRNPLRAVTGSTAGGGELPTGKDGMDGNEDISIQKIWELVRKSTDIIVALREENAILRNEVQSLRKSENTLQDRIQDFLGRIETLERVHYADTDVQPKMSTKQIDRLEDSVQPAIKQPSAVNRGNITITISIDNDGTVNVENKVRP